MKKVIVDPNTFVAREYEFYDEEAERDWRDCIDERDLF